MVQGRKIYEAMVAGEGKKGDAESEDAEGAEDAKGKADKAKVADPLKVNKKESMKASMEANVSKLDLGDGSQFQDHMDNLNKLESLLNKQEGLVGSLDKIDGMMNRLENLGGMVGKKKQE